MKSADGHVIVLENKKISQLSLKEELMKFAKAQFAVLKKKNLRLPVSIYHL